MVFSAIARIESYKHYQAGAIHKEATRQLTNYSNPNYNADLSHLNYYFERLDIADPFEQWIYKHRENNNIAGRYTEHSKNPKNETNALCQAFYTVPGYIDTLDRAEQIETLRHCYNFFKQEFPDVTVLEAVIHFDETSPHLQINFLPEVEREHKKRGKEKIFSTTLLMPGKDYFPKYQDRFYNYMQEQLQIDLERKKGSKAKHLAPKEYREVTAQLKALEQEKQAITEDIEEVKSDYQFYSNELHNMQNTSFFDARLELYERIRNLERENKFLKKFVSYICNKIPVINKAFEDFKKHYKQTDIDKII